MIDVGKVAGLVSPPQELHQRAGANGFTGAKQQSDEQRAGDAPPDRHLAPALLDTKRSEDTELHPTRVPTATFHVLLSFDPGVQGP